MIKLKTAEDIEKLRISGKRLAYVVSEVSKIVKPGVSTMEINDLAHKLIVEKGDTPAFLNYTPSSAKRPYPASICVSVNDEVVHGIPNENPVILKEGDIVKLDTGVNHDGMITDHAITVGVGNIDKDSKRLIDITREALQSGIKEARVGNRVGDISAAIESQAKKAGLGIAKGLSGHGVGYEVHEDPYVPNEGRKGRGEVLESGLVIAIEPMFVLGKGDIKLAGDGYTYKTKDGSLASQFEHTVLITENGPEVLTQL